MDLAALNMFIEVARRGSFAEVARERGVDPSSVSRTIAALEDALGIRLFQRTTRQVRLTEAGELYLKRVETLAQEIDVARDDALALSSGPRGTLRVTATVAFGICRLAPLLPAFRAAYPDLKVELVLADNNLDLVTERIDLAIRLAPGISGDLIGTKLMDTRYMICASPDYLRTAPAIETPRDLEHVSCVLYTLGDFRTRWRFRRAGEDLFDVPVQGQFYISNALAVRDSALRGLGPALLADWIASDAIRDGRLIRLFPDYDVTATNFATAAWLLYPSRSYLPSKVRVMIDFLKANTAAA